MSTCHCDDSPPERIRPPMGPSKLTDEDRFWSYVVKGPCCWLWAGIRTSRGYGSFFADRRTHRPNRYVYELVKGPIPKGMSVRHTCDQRGCVNPDHLLLGTHRDNMRDRLEREGYRSLQRGSERWNATLRESDVQEIRARLRGGETQTAITKSFGVSLSVVNRIHMRKTWKHVREFEVG